MKSTETVTNLIMFVPVLPIPRLAMAFNEPELRPPIYDEMVGDMGNLINKVVAPYVDPSCVELHFDELVAKCWEKTTEMNNRGLINRSRTRSEYFAQYKVAISHHIYSEVQRHRFTEKRTGVKPPPRNKRHLNNGVSSRPLEVRIDDPDANVQIAEIESGDDSAIWRELMEEVNGILNYSERGVLGQLLAPNEESLFHAKQDAEIGLAPNEPLRVRIRHEHLAKGIGMTTEDFHRHHEAIRQKCLYMKNQRDDDLRYTAAMATLIEFFGIQIPRSIDEITRKRALMIAAQHQYDRMKEDLGIQQAMKLCGIPVPEVRNDKFLCFGVMYQKHHRTCNNCGLKESCELKALNFGLGEITISHKLLGARHNRVAVVQPVEIGNNMSAITENERDEEILAFLAENFDQTIHMGEVCYRHRDHLDSKGMQLIFSVGKSVSPLRLRFINPADELKPSLKFQSKERGGRPAWYLPEELGIDDAINMIRAHAKVTFTRN